MTFITVQRVSKELSRRRKIYLLAALFLFISGFFVARVPDATRPELAGVSSLFVIFLALPSFVAAIKWLGYQRGFLLIAVLGAFAVVIETVAVKTGLPYGQFQYGNKIGVKFFGMVPWTVLFAWSPLVLSIAPLALCSDHSESRALLKSVVWGAIWLTVFDLVLDPGAVAQGFWFYQHPGVYYGVPWSNFVGWLVSGAVGMCLFYWCAGPKLAADGRVPPQLSGSAFLILSFWTSVCLWMSLWIPALVGVALMGRVGYSLLEVGEPQVGSLVNPINPTN